MNRDAIDLSCIDPTRSPERWEARIAAIASGAYAGYRRRLTLLGQLREWSQPVLLAAAAIAVIGIAALTAAKKTVATSKVDSTMMMTAWAVSGEVPNTYSVMQVLGGAHGDP